MLFYFLTDGNFGHRSRMVAVKVNLEGTSWALRR